MNTVRELQKREIYTTGDIAEICCCAPRTVSQWIDKGLLKGYQIPGSNHRRVQHIELIRFMISNGLPIPADLNNSEEN